jgi:hypothetical protein
LAYGESVHDIHVGNGADSIDLRVEPRICPRRLNEIVELSFVDGVGLMGGKELMPEVDDVLGVLVVWLV